MDLHAKSDTIKNLAQLAGFDACGMAKVRPLDEHKKHLQLWLEKGMHADMTWMANHFEKRINPALLLDNAKTVIVLLKKYSPDTYLFDDHRFKISRYALGEDYHQVIKHQLNQLWKQINKIIGPANGRCFVDSAPVMERAWAVEAGLGWIGKNGLLLNKKLGSFFFIGEIICDLPLAYDTPVKEHCGSCTSCLKACPTGALCAPKIVDARKCISYHTIENKGIIPEEVGKKLNGRIFGCDICQEVCPWNRKAMAHNEQAFMPSEGLKQITDNDWQHMSHETFNMIFHKSAVKRTGYTSLMRNISLMQ